MQADQTEGIPTFPPFCAAKISDSEECSLWGITVPCHKAFSDDTLETFGYGLLASHIWTFIVTLTIGIVSLWNIKGPWSFRRHSLKTTCGLYAIETSFFALVRFFFGVCKPLVAAASLHNLFEWSIVLHCAQGTTDINVLRKRLCIAALFINIQIITCLSVPDFETSLGLEMIFGLMMDFGIPLLFISQLSDPHRRPLYSYAALAHMVHLFGTILPLVFAIHFSSHASWFGGFFLEILINVSVPLTHFLYCYWSYQIEYVADENGITMTMATTHEEEKQVQGVVEKARRLSHMEKQYQPIASAEKLYEENTSATHQTSGAVTAEISGKEGEEEKCNLIKIILAEVSHYHPDEPCKSCGIVEERRIRNVWRFLIIGFFLGLIPLLVVPKLLMNECEGGDRCFSKSYVTKTSVVTTGDRSQATIASQQVLSSDTRTKLERILKSQNPGLISVRLLKSDGASMHENSFHTVESWKDLTSMNHASVSVSNVMAGGNVKGIDAYTHIQATTCRGKETGVIKMKTTTPCTSLSKVLQSGNYCGWIPGCMHIGETNDGLLSLYMKDGSIISAVGGNNGRHSTEVAVLSKSQLSGFEGRLSLQEDASSGVCDLTYSFHLIMGEGSVGSSFFYDGFIERFIPDLHERALG